MNTHPSASYLRVAACAASAFLGLVSTVAAQTAVRTTERTMVTTSPSPTLKRADRDFLEKAAKTGMEEVDISRVAMERSTNPDVRRLAQTIVSEHDSVNEQLASLAAARGVALPAKEINADNSWSKRNAKSFDKDYLDKMVSLHEDTVKLFDRQARDGNDPDTVAFARKHLSAMQRHLQQALDLKRALK